MERSEKEVYEEHLTQLQEQLVAAMIENSNLASELKEYRDTDSLQQMKCELEKERKRCRNLEEELLKEGNRLKKNQVTRNEMETVPDKRENSKGSTTNTKFNRFWERFVRGMYEIIDDFSEDSDTQAAQESEGDPLTVKKLKENIKRFSDSFKPYIRTLKGIQNLLTWKNPAYTLIVFMIYMYAVWEGWLVPVLLFCLCLRLGLSYLEHEGLNVQFNFFDPGEETKNGEETTLGISDKFNLVLDVARKVQNVLGQGADSLEKIKSLLTWRTPMTRSLFLSLFGALVASCLVPASHICYFCGLMMGVKLFIINYFYNKYPRIKRKYDSAYKMWQILPTDADYQKKSIQSEIDKYIIVNTDEEEYVNVDTADEYSDIKDDDRAFCQLFSLPSSECPVNGWKGGKRCSMINKDKSIAAAFKNGKLWLTKSFICFERKKTPSPKNIIIPLTDIQSISKAKPYSILPGSGMAIDIVISGDKHFLFGGIIGRDEAYDSILDLGLKKRLPWATGLPFEEEQIELPLTRRSSKNKFQNFSMASDYIDSD